MISRPLVDAVVDNYYATRTYKDTPHPKRLVLFSGAPGSGKSTMARAIAGQTRGVLISNDEIRDLIVRMEPAIDAAAREQAKLEAATSLLEKLSAIPNGLIINDASCDRGYDSYAAWAQKHNYHIILFRLDIPRAAVEQRIKARGDAGYRSASKSLTYLDTWWKQWEEFGRRHRPALTITQDTPIEEAIKIVERSLRHA